MPTPEESPRRPRPHLGHWLAELLLVFLGAYAAFWLSNYQEHREEAQRHGQILAELEREATEALASGQDNLAKQKQIGTELRRALAAGEMPPLHPFNFQTDYSPTDVATLLQSGGYQLLDVKTITALREVETTLRSGLSATTHYQVLSDNLVVPNLGKDISYFYDPATKKLREPFSYYPQSATKLESFFQDYVAAEAALLKQIQAERRR